MNALLMTLLLLVTASFSTTAQNDLPLATSSLTIKPLSSLANETLQQDLEKEIRNNPAWKTLVQENRMAIGVVDLSDLDNIRYASVNDSYMMYAASLPKIAVLLAAMDAIEKGELVETEAIKKEMRLMISKSDNDATTAMIDRLGYPKIESVMRDPKYKFYDENQGGGLWVGKRYASGGGTNREPLKNLSHAATIAQVCKFYYMLVNGELVNKVRSAQMLDIMGTPELHHKFVNVIEQIAPDAQLFRKSGSWENFHSDSILVWEKDSNRKYILVALVDDAAGEAIIRSLVKPIEKVLKIK